MVARSVSVFEDVAFGAGRTDRLVHHAITRTVWG